MAHTRYLSSALDRRWRQATIEWVAAQIATHFPDCDAIAFRGVSGALIAPSVADKLGKHLIVSRKANDDSHSIYDVESSSTKVKNYAIVDDLIGTGNTLRTIRFTIENTFPKARCVGVVLYHPTQCHATGTVKFPPYYRKDNEARIDGVSVPLISKLRYKKCPSCFVIPMHSNDFELQKIDTRMATAAKG